VVRRRDPLLPRGDVRARERPRSTLELLFSLGLLDEIADDEPAAAPLLERFGAAIPPDGSLHVEGGAPDEYIRPLDFSPLPDRPVRRLLAPDAVAADLDRLADRQGNDGGWDVDHTPNSPAAVLDWRGHITVRALAILRANGRLPEEGPLAFAG
jgi:hypothetical protein